MYNGSVVERKVVSGSLLSTPDVDVTSNKEADSFCSRKSESLIVNESNFSQNSSSTEIYYYSDSLQSSLNEENELGVDPGAFSARHKSPKPMATADDVNNEVPFSNFKSPCQEPQCNSSANKNIQLGWKLFPASPAMKSRKQNSPFLNLKKKCLNDSDEELSDLLSVLDVYDVKSLNVSFAEQVASPLKSVLTTDFKVAEPEMTREEPDTQDSTFANHVMPLNIQNDKKASENPVEQNTSLANNLFNIESSNPQLESETLLIPHDIVQRTNDVHGSLNMPLKQEEIASDNKRLSEFVSENPIMDTDTYKTQLIASLETEMKQTENLERDIPNFCDRSEACHQSTQDTHFDNSLEDGNTEIVPEKSGKCLASENTDVLEEFTQCDAELFFPQYEDRFNNGDTVQSEPVIDCFATDFNLSLETPLAELVEKLEKMISDTPAKETEFKKPNDGHIPQVIKKINLQNSFSDLKCQIQNSEFFEFSCKTGDTWDHSLFFKESLDDNQALALPLQIDTGIQKEFKKSLVRNPQFAEKFEHCDDTHDYLLIQVKGSDSGQMQSSSKQGIPDVQSEQNLIEFLTPSDDRSICKEIEKLIHLEVPLSSSRIRNNESSLATSIARKIEVTCSPWSMNQNDISKLANDPDVFFTSPSRELIDDLDMSSRKKNVTVRHTNRKLGSKTCPANSGKSVFQSPMNNDSIIIFEEYDLSEQVKKKLMFDSQPEDLNAMSPQILSNSFLQANDIEDALATIKYSPFAKKISGSELVKSPLVEALDLTDTISVKSSMSKSSLAPLDLCVRNESTTVPVQPIPAGALATLKAYGSYEMPKYNSPRPVEKRVLDRALAILKTPLKTRSSSFESEIDSLIKQDTEAMSKVLGCRMAERLVKHEVKAVKDIEPDLEYQQKSCTKEQALEINGKVISPRLPAISKFAMPKINVPKTPITKPQLKRVISTPHSASKATEKTPKMGTQGSRFYTPQKSVPKLLPPRPLSAKKYENVESPVNKYIQDAPPPPLIQVLKPQKMTSIPKIRPSHIIPPKKWDVKENVPILPHAKYIAKPEIEAKNVLAKPKNSPILRQQNVSIPVLAKHIGSKKFLNGQKFLMNEMSGLEHSFGLKRPQRSASNLDTTVVEKKEVIRTNTIGTARTLIKKA